MTGIAGVAFLGSQGMVMSKDARWWCVKLSPRQIDELKEEARALTNRHGIQALEVVLEKARALGKRHSKEARLSADKPPQILVGPGGLEPPTRPL